MQNSSRDVKVGRNDRIGNPVGIRGGYGTSKHTIAYDTGRIRRKVDGGGEEVVTEFASNTKVNFRDRVVVRRRRNKIAKASRRRNRC